MSGTLRLFRPLLRRALWGLGVCLWITSILNWCAMRVPPSAYVEGLPPRAPSADLYLELELVIAGLMAAYAVHRGCSRAVMEYLVSLPPRRAASLGAPLRAGTVALVGLAALLLLHEYTGAACIELRALGLVLPIDQLPAWHRPLHPWLNVLVLPLAAFWVNTAAMRWWTSAHETEGGRFAIGAPLIGGLVFAALAMSLLLGHRHLPRPWDLSVPAIPWLLATLGAAHFVQRQLATTPTETYPVGESRWTS